MSGPAAVVLHRVGDEEGGGPWRHALTGAGWPGPVLAPDLPGHAGAPAPVGGAYEPTDPAVSTLRALHAAALPGPPVVIGVATSGWPAQLLAVGGRACGLVLVDGLGGPFLTAVESVAAGRRQLRAIAADPDAVAPPTTGGLDPRLRHGVLVQPSRPFAQRTVAAVAVPTLVVETPRSGLDRAEVDDLTGRFTAPVDVVFLGDPDPSLVAGEIVAWQERTSDLPPTGPS